MPKKIEMVGKTFGQLTVVNELPARSKCGGILYRCRCTCGGWAPAVYGISLRKGYTGSCGCQSSRNKIGDLNRSHGLSDKSGNSHYTRWRSIKTRTGNPNCNRWEHYGGRGIKFHQPWADNFILFKNWLDENLGPCPDGWTLDRIDVDGNYEPGNLRWASAKTQNLNRRKK